MLRTDAPLDRAELRRRLVTGWRPRQHVEVEISVLERLLDELDELELQVALLRANDDAKA